MPALASPIILTTLHPIPRRSAALCVVSTQGPVWSGQVNLDEGQTTGGNAGSGVSGPWDPLSQQRVTRSASLRGPPGSPRLLVSARLPGEARQCGLDRGQPRCLRGASRRPPPPSWTQRSCLPPRSPRLLVRPVRPAVAEPGGGPTRNIHSLSQAPRGIAALVIPATLLELPPRRSAFSAAARPPGEASRRRPGGLTESLHSLCLRGAPRSPQLLARPVRPGGAADRGWVRRETFTPYLRRAGGSPPWLSQRHFSSSLRGAPRSPRLLARAVRPAAAGPGG